ncbi:DUF503 domain-containing protein [Frankia sp. AgPm24]|uniref:DUF503 domain-containing protein n=1 Tax=Frankia umida TaxID=573489 RepID=A0ABT0JXC7_9ACTN|nr:MULTISPECIES: DUF503 domain-containing protein [Frankia]MCK9876200.1 DUF503 domain-containing protein [Frankia umida]MCK9922429.1 DUF503 domain-containing protein [Frankia sp. AgPm24]
MWIASLSLDLLLGDVHSLKEKRSVVRPIVAELRRRFAVSVAETGQLDLHRRAEIGVAVVAADRGHCMEVLRACEQLVAQRPEVDVLAARERVFTEDDADGASFPDPAVR